MLHAIRSRRESFWRDRKADAVLDFIEDDIVFQGVGANDVVVVGVLIPPHDSGGLVNCATNRFESNAHGAVQDRNAVPNRQRKPAGGAILG